MSGAVFPFRFLRRGFREAPEFRNEVHAQSGGRRVVQKVHAGGELAVTGTILFPNPGGTWAAFRAFWEARSGGFDSFLYKAQNPGAAAVHEDLAVDSGVQVDFPLLRRFVDTASLVVKKGGVVQTPGVHYTLQNGSGGAYVLGTSPVCVVHFAVAPGLAADLDADHDFYYPVRFEGDDLASDQDVLGGGTGSAVIADRTVTVSLRETGPGYHLASAPTAL